MFKNIPHQDSAASGDDTSNKLIGQNGDKLKFGMTPFFYKTHGNFLENFATNLIFVNGELYIILKLRDLEIGQRSSFFNYCKKDYLTRCLKTLFFN